MTTTSANAHPDTRHPSPAWGLALLLVLAVCVWGLHYKLSLYHPLAVNARGPAAKLLSEKERPVASTQLEQALASGKPLVPARHPVATPLVAAWTIFVPKTNQPVSRALLAPRDSLHRSPFVRSRPSSPRPPPILV